MHIEPTLVNYKNIIFCLAFLCLTLIWKCTEIVSEFFFKLAITSFIYVCSPQTLLSHRQKQTNVKAPFQSVCFNCAYWERDALEKMTALFDGFTSFTGFYAFWWLHKTDVLKKIKNIIFYSPRKELKEIYWWVCKTKAALKWKTNTLFKEIFIKYN